jgi:hypothetical protein
VIAALELEFTRDDPGHPLGRGMPTGRPQRADGESHRAGWIAVVRQDPCSYCESRADTVDHVEPRSRTADGLGGAHSWLNYAGACARCNHAKAADSLIAFLYRRRWSTGLDHPKLPAHGRPHVAGPRRRGSCEPRRLPAEGGQRRWTRGLTAARRSWPRGLRGGCYLGCAGFRAAAPPGSQVVAADGADRARTRRPGR